MPLKRRNILIFFCHIWLRKIVFYIKMIHSSLANIKVRNNFIKLGKRFSTTTLNLRETINIFFIPVFVSIWGFQIQIRLISQKIKKCSKASCCSVQILVLAWFSVAAKLKLYRKFWGMYLLTLEKESSSGILHHILNRFPF